MQDFNLKAVIIVNLAFIVSFRNPRTLSNKNTLKWYLWIGYSGLEALVNLTNYSDGVHLKGGPILTQYNSCGIFKITH